MSSNVQDAKCRPVDSAKTMVIIVAIVGVVVLAYMGYNIVIETRHVSVWLTAPGGGPSTSSSGFRLGKEYTAEQDMVVFVRLWNTNNLANVITGYINSKEVVYGGSPAISGGGHPTSTTLWMQVSKGEKWQVEGRITNKSPGGPGTIDHPSKEIMEMALTPTVPKEMRVGFDILAMRR